MGTEVTLPDLCQVLIAITCSNVQVTLQILTSLIEKAPRDLPLYARSVLTIIDTVMRSKDINMVEETIPTFEMYCKHLDFASITADQARSKQYQAIVQTYALFASKEPPPELRSELSTPIAVRWRMVGLKAIKSVVGSEATEAESTKQLNLVMPAILENLYSGEDDILSSLQKSAQTSEKVDFDNARRRRMSMATVTTVDTVETNPATAAGTTADADKLAEDELRVLAVRCLKQIFTTGTGSNRGQVRLATTLTLRFIATRNSPRISTAQTSSRSNRQGNWATSLIEAVAKWTPVQDRFVIVVTAMETLVRSPMIESKLHLQLTLATMIDWLLSSSINLIGLSVMDVLLGFVQHTLLLLQLGGRDSKIAPHHQQTDALDLFQDAKETFENGSPFHEADRGRSVSSTEKSASPVRQELLLRLQKCIGNLATHIYYTDQISDMMTAILARLKPSPLSDISSAAAAIQNPAAAVREISNSVALQENPATDAFFSFATARITALRAIKDILVTANLRRTQTGAAAEARSRVGIQVWEGTQWLLRDEDRGVRRAYVDALLTWLKLETNKNDLHLPKERTSKLNSKKRVPANGEDRLSRRAVSNASRRDIKPAKSTFLQLLHLAVYENALESPENAPDILLLHLLLSTLIERLGVNAIRQGLPMVARLQEDFAFDDKLDAPAAKVNIASLVHGYFWTLSEKFDFEGSRIGGEIHLEISRRKRFGVWLDQIRQPAIPIDQIPRTSWMQEKSPELPEPGLQTLKPYLNRFDLVEEIAVAYDASLTAPVMSPPASPGRVFSVPTLGFGYGYGISPGLKPSPDDQLPQKVKDEMLLDWTRETCIASVAKIGAKSASMTGSRAGTSAGTKTYLKVNGANSNGSGAGNESPTPAQQENVVEGSPAFGLTSGLGSLQKNRRISGNGGSPTPLTESSSRDSTIRVSELKRALSGYQIRHSSPMRKPGASRLADSVHSSGTESLVSYSDGEGFNNSALDVHDIGSTDVATKPAVPDGMRSQSSHSKRDSGRTKPNPASNDIAHTTSQVASDPKLGEDVPHVPQNPKSLNLPGTYPQEESPTRPKSSSKERVIDVAAQGTTTFYNIVTSTVLRTPETSREGRSVTRGKSRPSSRRGEGATNLGDATISSGGRLDLGRLLAGIRTDTSSEGLDEARENTGSTLMKPPY